MFQKSEICFLYGVSMPTFRKMLIHHGIEKDRRLLSPKDVDEIFNALGYPPGWEIVRYANGGIKWFKDVS